MLPGVAERLNVRLPSLLARAGMAEDGFRLNGAVATRSQVCTLLNELARQSGDATVGLDLAASADPLQLGLSGRALLSGRTLRECLLSHARHMPTLQGGVDITLDETGGRAYWRHTLADSDAGHAGVLHEGIAAFVIGALRALSGAAGGDLRLELPHRAKTPVRLYEDKLQAGVSFGGGPGLSVSFDAAWLDRPNRLFAASLELGEAGSAMADESDWRDDGALAAALERIFAGAALAGTLSLVDASRSLGLAPRSLQRRLAASGTSFEALVDGWRRTQARHHLADPALEIGGIARLLGYRDPSHFIRAFRRWEGMAPFAYRRAALARNGN